MHKKILCIVCPIGCTLDVEMDDVSILSIEGNLCSKGEEYAGKEIFNPERTLTTSVRVTNGEMPLASVRSSKPIPKHLIIPVVKDLKRSKFEAPVDFGQIIMNDVRGTGADIVVTREVKRQSNGE